MPLSKLNGFLLSVFIDFQKSIINFLILTLLLLRVKPLSSQNVMIHHGQTQEYVLKPKYFSAQKVISGEQSTEGSFPLRFGPDHLAPPFQCEYGPVSHLAKFQYRCRWL